MSEITALLQSLDEMREKAIVNGRVLRIDDDTRPSTDFFRALETAYPQLRAAALEWERLQKIFQRDEDDKLAMSLHDNGIGEGTIAIDTGPHNHPDAAWQDSSTKATKTIGGCD